MTIKQLEFKFKGARNYIHGTDMFNTMTTVYPVGSLSKIRFSVHGIVHSPHCQVVIADNKEILNTIADIRARCQFDANGSTYWLVLTEMGNNSTPSRYEYDEQQLLTLCHLENDTITLDQQSPYSFIESIVAMNKCLLEHLFPNVRGKWLFTRIDLDTLYNDRNQLSLQFKHNMNFRLTKSDILVNAAKVGELYFSLVEA